MVLLRLENQQAFGLEVSLEFFEISFQFYNGVYLAVVRVIWGLTH